MGIQIGYFPGCSLHSSAKEYNDSIKASFGDLEVELKEIPDWNCCGATAAHSLNEALALALPARNLAMAEREGLPLFAPCSACYHRFLLTNRKLHANEELLLEVNELIDPLDYKGGTEVRNILEILVEDVGVKKIREKVKKPLKGMRVVSYYGCLLTRVPHGRAADDQENPVYMDEVVEALGAEPVPWPSKMDCCGASLNVTEEAIVCRLSSHILDNAQAVTAQAVVTSCTLCQMNLDLMQSGTKPEYNHPAGLPVFYISELLALAMGHTFPQGHWKKHFVNPKGVLEPLGLL